MPSQIESIDQQRIDQLKLLMGDKFLGFTDLFVSQLNQRIDILELAIGEDKADSILQAHSIKGSAANMGASKLVSIVKQLETMLEKDDIEGAANLLLEIKDELDIVKDVLIYK